MLAIILKRLIEMNNSLEESKNIFKELIKDKKFYAGITVNNKQGSIIVYAKAEVPNVFAKNGYKFPSHFQGYPVQILHIK